MSSILTIGSSFLRYWGSIVPYYPGFARKKSEIQSMRINAREWRKAFAMVPVLIGDEWVWLEPFEYRTTAALSILPMFELRKIN